MTATQRRTVQLTIRDELILEKIDAWLFDRLERGESLVILRKKAILPVVLQRAALSDALVKRYALLGLDRKAPKPIDPIDFLNQRVAAREAATEPTDADDHE